MPSFGEKGGAVMAKRFTDTDKWKKAWFRKLGSQGRDLWSYLHDNCDFAGFFEIDCGRISFELGFEVTLNLIGEVLNGRWEIITPDSIFLPAFIDFQYGVLNESVKPHQSVIRKMKSKGVWEQYAKGYLTPKDKDKDKDKDKEQDKEKGGVGENKIPFEPTPLKPPPQLPPSEFVHDVAPIDAGELDLCYLAWLETLRFFKGGRSKILPREQLQIAQAVQRQGNATAVMYALRGPRYEPKNEGYNPADFVSLERVLDIKKFDRFMNLGIQAEHKKAGGT